MLHTYDVERGQCGFQLEIWKSLKLKTEGFPANKLIVFSFENIR